MTSNLDTYPLKRHLRALVSPTGDEAIEALETLERELAELRSFKQAVLDPENQPSQFGTVLVHETPAPQAPIARIIVRESGAAHYAPDMIDVKMYAPGLPPGEHDVYCVPEATAPMLREKAPANYGDVSQDVSMPTFNAENGKGSQP